MKFLLKKASKYPSKYRNIKVGGYASKKEKKQKHGDFLTLLEKAGVITDLKRQVLFRLLPSQKNDEGKVIEHAVTYKADFTYINQKGEYVVVDVKGVKTPLYIVKRKLMLFFHGIKIKEI